MQYIALADTTRTDIEIESQQEMSWICITNERIMHKKPITKPK